MRTASTLELKVERHSLELAILVSEIEGVIVLMSA
jgi:hypothetical protein